MIFQTCFLTFRPEYPYLTVKLDSASELALDWAAGWTRSSPEVPANLSYSGFLTCALFTACGANCFPSPNLFTVTQRTAVKQEEHPVCGGWIFFHRFTCQLSDATLHSPNHRPCWLWPAGRAFLGAAMDQSQITSHTSAQWATMD